ncbi:MAG TPA: hypothetical protein VFW30_09155 [Bryocella sp.]|nr:hypothetical protein [Bryocella sp.]
MLSDVSYMTAAAIASRSVRIDQRVEPVALMAREGPEKPGGFI